MPCRLRSRRQNKILRRQLKIKRCNAPRRSHFWVGHQTAAGQTPASLQLRGGKNVLLRRQAWRRMAHKTHAAAPATPKPATQGQRAHQPRKPDGLRKALPRPCGNSYNWRVWSNAVPVCKGMVTGRKKTYKHPLRLPDRPCKGKHGALPTVRRLIWQKVLYCLSNWPLSCIFQLRGRVRKNTPQHTFSRLFRGWYE